jgi:hypothetical protein
LPTALVRQENAGRDDDRVRRFAADADHRLMGCNAAYAKPADADLFVRH